MKGNIIIIVSLAIFQINVYSQDYSGYQFKSLDNNIFSIDDLKGEKITVIDFWATWCKPCVQSLPKLNEVYNKYKDQGVQFVGMNIDGPRNMAKVP